MSSHEFAVRALQNKRSQKISKLDAGEGAAPREFDARADIDKSANATSRSLVRETGLSASPAPCSCTEEEETALLNWRDLSAAGTVMFRELGTLPESLSLFVTLEAPLMETPPEDRTVTSVDGVQYYMPEQFGIVEEGVYRCSFPAPYCYNFLDKLGIKTVINLLDQCPPAYADFLRSKPDLDYYHLAVKGNKSTCHDMDINKVLVGLSKLIDVSCHPVLVHCRSGKHRTGTLVGCLRMLQHWPLDKASAEYVAYCKHKQRDVDVEFMGRFDPRRLALVAPPKEVWPQWIPGDALEGGPLIFGESHLQPFSDGRQGGHGSSAAARPGSAS